MKISPLTLLLALALGIASVQAMTVATVTRNPGAQEQASNTSKDAQFESFCLRQTGSHIVSNKREVGKRCIAGNGRVYTREDLDRTGETDMAAALRKLDPAIH